MAGKRRLGVGFQSTILGLVSPVAASYRRINHLPQDWYFAAVMA